MSKKKSLIAGGTWALLHRSNGTLPRNRGAAVDMLSQPTSQGGDFYRERYFDMLRKDHPAIVTYLTVALCDPTNKNAFKSAQRALTSDERRIAGHIIAAVESKTKRPASEVFASTSSAKEVEEGRVRHPEVKQRTSEPKAIEPVMAPRRLPLFMESPQGEPTDASRQDVDTPVVPGFFRAKWQKIFGIKPVGPNG